MEKNIRDFLHLYIGCDYQWQDEDGEWSKPQTLTSYQYSDIMRHWISCRLILRPLSSMTESEKKELNWYDLELKHVISQTRERSLYTSEWLYLLKKGFDLFQLIESDLAYEKHT